MATSQSSSVSWPRIPTWPVGRRSAPDAARYASGGDLARSPRLADQLGEQADISECVPLDSSFSRSRTISSAVGTGISRSTTRAPIAASTLRGLGLRPDRAEHPGARAHDRDGLVAQGVGRPAGARPSPARSSAGPGSSGCTRASRSGSRRPRRSRSRSRWTDCGRVGPRGPRRTAGCPADRRRSRTPRRTAAAWLPPGGARCCASRGGGDPLMPRTRIGLRLGELELDDQLDVVGEGEAALGQRGVPVEAVGGAVDDGLEASGRPWCCRRCPRAGRRGAACRRRVGVALDRELAVDLDLVAVEADRRSTRSVISG